MTETETQQAHAFDKMKSKTTATYLGSKPPVDGKWESWADVRPPTFPFPTTLQGEPSASAVPCPMLRNCFKANFDGREYLKPQCLFNINYHSLQSY